MTTRTAILALSDTGRAVADIAAALDLTAGRIYTVLRQERPDRPRQMRRRTSAVPGKVKGLVGAGIAPARVAHLLGVSRAYVYRIMGE